MHTKIEMPTSMLVLYREDRNRGKCSYYDTHLHSNIQSLLLDSFSATPTRVSNLVGEGPMSMHTKIGTQTWMHAMCIKAQIRGKCSNTQLAHIKKKSNDSAMWQVSLSYLQYGPVTNTNNAPLKHTKLVTWHLLRHGYQSGKGPVSHHAAIHGLEPFELVI